MQTNFPSVRTLMLVIEDKNAATLARTILKAINREALESLPVYEKYYQTIGMYMYHEHSLSELKMQLLNIVFNGYGVEGIQNKKDDWMEFINFGDTYNMTVIYYHGRFFVSSWGNVVEKEWRLWNDD